MNLLGNARTRLLDKLADVVADSTDQAVVIERLTPDPVTGLGVEPWVAVDNPPALTGRIMVPASFYSPFRSGVAAQAEWSEEQPRTLLLPTALDGVVVDIQAGDRVTLAGDTYYVIEVKGASSWRPGLQATLQLHTPSA
jgi:hypothetical protein